jgi:CRISPR type III-B/RAMP module-associated protein Cmr5
MSAFNPIKDAINIYNEVYENFLKKLVSDNLQKTEKSLRARAREMPSLLQETGLLGVYSFCFGKGNEYYKKFIEYLENKNQEHFEKLKNETNVGYTVYLYLILKGIEKINKTINIIDVDVNDPKSFFNKINETSKIKIVEKLLLPYLTEIKKLCEGTLRSESYAE